MPLSPGAFLLLMTLLLGTGSYNALCINCPLLATLTEMTASAIGHLPDYPFLAATFSSFS